jgi:hypothetical protein
MTDDDAEVETFDQAVERLARSPNETAGACLMGFDPGALGTIANASDEALEEAADSFNDHLDAYRALRFLAGLVLTMKQARRYADLFQLVPHHE